MTSHPLKKSDEMFSVSRHLKAVEFGATVARLAVDYVA
jgi:hypothetical protein